MSVLQAIVLGALQGATEFLPVSSSGHLVIGRELLGLSDIPVLFDVLLHIATLTAVVVVLRRQVLAVATGTLRYLIGRRDEPARVMARIAVIIVCATLVTGILGVALRMVVDADDARTASALFLVTAVLLIAGKTRRGARTQADLGVVDGIVIGLFQAVAVLPGISRSGATITAGLFRGLDRGQAGEFSFLLSIPAILGALVLTLGDAEVLTAQLSVTALLAGCAAAMVVGATSIVLLLRLLRRGRLYLFAAYLVPLGIFGLIAF